jgi:hypothetical protein
MDDVPYIHLFWVIDVTGLVVEGGLAPVPHDGIGVHALAPRIGEYGVDEVVQTADNLGRDWYI